MLNKITCPEINPIAEKMAKAVGIEVFEDQEKLRERLAKIVPIYLLVCSGERIKFKPSDEAAALISAADRLSSDPDSRAAILEKMPVDWRGRIGDRGPSKRDLAQTQLRGVELIDHAIESAMADDAEPRILIRWMRRAARRLGNASAGAPKQGARRYAIHELEKLLEEICGESVTSIQADLTRQVRWKPLRRFLEAFFKSLGETVDAESLRSLRRSMSSK